MSLPYETKAAFRGTAQSQQYIQGTCWKRRCQCCRGNACEVRKRSSCCKPEKRPRLAFLSRSSPRALREYTYLRVLVSLGTKERLAICHFDGLFCAFFESLEFAKISPRVHETSTDSIGVSSDGANDADTGSLCPAHVLEKEIHKKKVSKMVDALKQPQ